MDIIIFVLNLLDLESVEPWCGEIGP